MVVREGFPETVTLEPKLKEVREGTRTVQALQRSIAAESWEAGVGPTSWAQQGGWWCEGHGGSGR